MKKTLDDFTNLYSLSKTLRFELKPIAETKENIEKGTIYIAYIPTIEQVADLPTKGLGKPLFE